MIDLGAMPRIGFGFIYKITNRQNGKVYIGQTTSSIGARWGGHCSEARVALRDQVHTVPLNNAINKYGEDNFVLEGIEEVSIDDLDTREIFWIREYDSCILNGSTKGYNATWGGQRNSRQVLTQQDVQTIIDEYQSGKTIRNLSCELGFSRDIIRQCITHHHIPIRMGSSYDANHVWVHQRYQITSDVKTTKKHQKLTFHAMVHNRVWQFSMDGMLIQIFDEERLAAQWVHQELETPSWAEAGVHIYNSFLQRKGSYGFYWFIENQEDRMHQSDEEFAQYATENPEDIISVDIDGTPFSFIRISGNYIIADLPDYNDLILEVYNSSFEATGRKYGVTGACIKKRLQSAGLPYRVKELREYVLDNGLATLPYSNDEVFDYYQSVCSLPKTAEHFHTSMYRISTILNEMSSDSQLMAMRIAEVTSSRNRKKPVVLFHNRTITYYESIAAAAKETGVSMSQISGECNGNRTRTQGWYFYDEFSRIDIDDI